MRSEKLERAAFTNPSSNVFTRSVEEICKLLISGAMVFFISIHENSWPTSRVVDYFNSMIFGNTPVSPIAINRETLSSYDDVPDIAPDISEGPVMISVSSQYRYVVIDGQQRVSSFHKAYTDDPDVSHIVLDLVSCKFKDVPVADEDQIPVGKLFNQDISKFFEYVSDRFSPEDINLLNAIRSKFLGYSIVAMFGYDLFRDEQLEWFTRLNNAGSSMTEAEMLMFKLDAKDLNPYADYVRPYNNMLSSYGFDHLLSSSRARTSYPLTSLNPAIEKMFRSGHKNNYTPIPSDVKIGVIDSFPPSDLKELFTQSLDALKWSLDFFKNRKIRPTRMEYVTYISGFYLLREPTVASYDMLEKWYRTTVFTDATNTQKRQIYADLLNREVL